MDLASLIPAGADAEPIEVGSSWDLPSSFMEEILRPGGSVMVFPEADLEEPDEGSISITLPGAGSFEREDEFDGDLVATFVEIVEEEDGRFAKISIKVDVSAELDVIDKLENSAD